MKAAVVLSPGRIVVQIIPNPVTGDYDVLCQTLACGVCCGTDNHILADHPYFKVKYPVVLGHEGVGRVIACGNKVRHFKIGDIITRVHNRLPQDSQYSLMYGAFADLSIATDWLAMREDGFASQKWEPFTIHRSIPSHLDPVEATMIITWRETYAFLKRMHPRISDSLLIIGSGATALAFADHARNIGIKKRSVVGNPSREKFFRDTGAGFFISYLHPEINSVLSKTSFPPFDLIIDTVGQSSTLNRVLALLNKNGKIGVYGLDSFHDYQLNLFQIPDDFSFFNGNFYDEGSAHEDIMEYILSEKLNPWRYLSKGHIYPLEKISDALNACKARKTVKSVVIFN